MAKLSANGCREIGKLTVRSGSSRHVFALRSDGKVLSRLAGFYNDLGEYTAHATGYSIYASLKPREGRSDFDRSDVERLGKILERKGYEVVR